MGVVFRRGAFYVAFYGTVGTPKKPQEPPTLHQEIFKMLLRVLHVGSGGYKSIVKCNGFFISLQYDFKLLLAGMVALASGYVVACWGLLWVPIVS